MINLKAALTGLVILSSSIAFSSDLVCPTKDFIRNCEKNENCPAGVAGGKYFSRTTMYGPMVQGASDSGRGITIVDENDFGNRGILDSYPAQNESLFDQYNDTAAKKGARGKYSKKYAYRGLFKIGYRYNATECRRQIILGKHLRDKNKESLGLYNGFTSIEICNPGIMKLFAAGKQAMAGKGGMPTINHFLGFVDNVHKAGQLDDNTYYQIKQNLAMTPSQAKAVMYYKDADGDILPRFAVKIKSFRWEEYGSTCTMIIDHKDEANDYAGLMSAYRDDYSWGMDLDPKTPSDLNLWYWKLPTTASGQPESKEYNYVEVVDSL